MHLLHIPAISLKALLGVLVVGYGVKTTQAVIPVGGLCELCLNTVPLFLSWAYYFLTFASFPLGAGFTGPVNVGPTRVLRLKTNQS